MISNNLPNIDRPTAPRPAFTLIELLITIGVLVVLAALVIPSVRLISKERQTRETGRIVGSTMVAAQSQAITDGYAGILIQRNPNLGDGIGSTRIYRVKSPRPFTGYGVNAFAQVDPTNQTASLPAIYNDSLPDAQRLVHINDYIQFNHRGPRYRIIGVQRDPVAPTTRTLVNFDYLPVNSLDRRFVHPPLPEPVSPATTVSMEFKVFRRPVVVPTTVTELPAGFMINLEFSGHGATGSQFFITGTDNPIVIIFNDEGAIDLIYEQGLSNPPTRPQGPVNLLISELDVENNRHPLANMNNLWVTANRTNGIVSVGNLAEISIDPSVDAASKAAALAQSRQVARKGKSANQ